MKHSKEQIRKTAKNFEILADYISKNVSQKFIDMENFYTSVNGGYLNKELLRKPIECGASACALGHSTFVIPPRGMEFDLKGDINFGTYGMRVYPADYKLELGNFGPDTNELWDSVFNGDLSSKKADVISRLRQKSKELLKSIEQPDRFALFERSYHFDCYDILMVTGTTRADVRQFAKEEGITILAGKKLNEANMSKTNHYFIQKVKSV